MRAGSKGKEGAVTPCVRLTLVCSPVTGSSPAMWVHLLQGSCASDPMLEALPWYGPSVCLPHNLPSLQVMW